MVQLHTGSANAALTRPSMGAWLLYGLGTENQDLPGYITIDPPPNFGGAVNYGSAFLPAYYQGTRINDEGYLPNLKVLHRRRLGAQGTGFDPGDEPRLRRPARARPIRWMGSSNPMNWLSDAGKSSRPARHFQGAAARLGCLRREIRPDGSFARQCLMARRLSEAGVRFVEICQGGWDHHTNLHKGLIDRCGSVDQPVAALLADLGQRGLLDHLAPPPAPPAA